MKRVGVIGTAVLLLLFGAIAFGYPQQDRHGDKQGKPEKPAAAEKQKGKHQPQAQNKQERAQQEPQQDQNQPQRAQRQQRAEPRQHAQIERTQEQRQSQEGEQHGAWRERRAHNWESEHRNWQQRGGYDGYRIPVANYRSHFGRHHGFRVYSLPFMVVGGYPRFQYEGYWISFVDSYPEYWQDNWYETDDVYVRYVDNGYYLYNTRYPQRPGITISISF